jgi:histidine kinase-like protein
VPSVVLPVQERTGSRSCEGTWRFTAPALDCSVPRLRHAVRDLVRRQGVVPEEILQNLLLILSELATNAVRHAALLSPEIGVEVRLQGGWLRIAVEDSHPYRPKALDADPDQEHIGGRGLLLVKMITSGSGGLCDVEQTGTGGKVIWAALPLPVVSGVQPPAVTSRPTLP